VLDGRGEPAGVGLAGELHIGGVGLARGYLNRPGLTAERFIPDPFGREPGARLYRTGDLCRYLPSGDIEFLGRMDHQVKVRGFRIELGEIEAVLAEHEGIREAAVVAREEGGDRRLVAYVVAAAGDEADAAGLRAHLRGRLPEYMVPSAFVRLEELPLTPNGKLDRHALLRMDAPELRVERPYVAPSTPVEEELAAMWREILGVGQVGIHDNFFELGGHSLLVTRLSSNIRREFQVEISLRALFEAPTIAEMSRLVLARQFEQVDPEKVEGMLQKLKQLSAEEMKAILETTGPPPGGAL
jgi:acyl carrier protein